MTATLVKRDTPRKGTESFPATIACGVYRATTILEGTIVAVDTTHGFAVAGATSTAQKVIGIAKTTVVNAGDDGALDVECIQGFHKLLNSAASDAITNAERFALCYLVDNQTVAKTNGSNTRSPAGIVYKVEADGVWVWIGALPHLGATYVTLTGGETLTNKRLVRRVGTDITATGTVQVAEGEWFEVIPGAATTITLGTTNVAEGDTFVFWKPGTEAYAVTVGSLMTIPASLSGFIEVVYLHGAWKLASYEIRAGARPIAVQAAALTFVGDDVTVAVADGEEFDIPTTGGNSTVTISTVGAVKGSKMRFRADGSKNAHTVTYRVGVTAITAAATNGKKHLCDASFDGTAWVAALSVGP